MVATPAMSPGGHGLVEVPAVVGRQRRSVSFGAAGCGRRGRDGRVVCSLPTSASRAAKRLSLDDD
jgi:hypothetical protein